LVFTTLYAAPLKLKAPNKMMDKNSRPLMRAIKRRQWLIQILGIPRMKKKVTSGIRIYY
jgi:hypothetical protein